jgi:hypothetical protein
MPIKGSAIKLKKESITEANIPHIPAKYSYYKMTLSFLTGIAKTHKHLQTPGELQAELYQQHKHTFKN